MSCASVLGARRLGGNKKCLVLAVVPKLPPSLTQPPQAPRPPARAQAGLRPRPRKSAKLLITPARVPPRRQPVLHLSPPRPRLPLSLQPRLLRRLQRSPLLPSQRRLLHPLRLLSQHPAVAAGPSVPAANPRLRPPPRRPRRTKCLASLGLVSAIVTVVPAVLHLL